LVHSTALLRSGSARHRAERDVVDVDLRSGERRAVDVRERAQHVHVAVRADDVAQEAPDHAVETRAHQRYRLAALVGRGELDADVLGVGDGHLDDGGFDQHLGAADVEALEDRADLLHHARIGPNDDGIEALVGADHGLGVGTAAGTAAALTTLTALAAAAAGLTAGDHAFEQ